MPMGRIYRHKPKSRAVPKATKAYVKRAVKADLELNHYDTVTTNKEVNSDQTEPFSLSAIPQGDGAEERAGDVVRLQSLDVRLLMNRVGASSTDHDLVRCVIFRWKQNSASIAPTNARIYETSTPLAQFHSESLPMNMTVLYDKSFVLPPIGDEFETKFQRIKLNLRNAKMQLNDTAVTGNNKIYISFVGLYSDASDAGSNVNLIARLKYTDG